MNTPGDEVIHGQRLITSPGTSRQLSATTVTLKNGVLIRALSTNVDKLYIGGPNVTKSNGHQIVKGESTSLAIKDLSAIYIIGDGAGDGISFLASV